MRAGAERNPFADMHVAPNLAMIGGSLAPNTAYYRVPAAPPAMPLRREDANNKAMFGICRYRNSEEYHRRKETSIPVSPLQQGVQSFPLGGRGEQKQLILHQEDNASFGRQAGAKQAEAHGTAHFAGVGKDLPTGRFVIPGQWGRRLMAGSFRSNRIWRDKNIPPKAISGASVTEWGGGGSKRPRHSTGNSRHDQVQPRSVLVDRTPSQYNERRPKNGERGHRGDIDSRAEQFSKAGHVPSVVMAGRWLEANMKPGINTTSPFKSDEDVSPLVKAPVPASCTIGKLLRSRWRTVYSSAEVKFRSTTHSIPTVQLRAPISSATTGANDVKNDIERRYVAQLPVAPISAKTTKERAEAEHPCEGTNAGARGMTTSPPRANVTHRDVSAGKHGGSPRSFGRTTACKGITSGAACMEKTLPARPPSFGVGRPKTPFRCVA